MEINGNRYICKSKRHDRIREFAENDPKIFETEEAAMKRIKEMKREKASFVAIYFLLVAVIVIAILMIQMQ